MKGAVPPPVRPSPRKRVAGRLRRVAGYGAGGRRNPAAFAAWGPPAHWAVSPSPRGGGRRGLGCRWGGARRWAGTRLRRVAAQRPPVGPGARPVPKRGAKAPRRALWPVPLLAFRCGRPGSRKRPSGCLGAPWLPPCCLAAKKSYLCYPAGGVPRPSPRRCGPCRSSRSAVGVPAPQRLRGDALGAPWLPPCCLAAKKSFLSYPSLLPLSGRPLRATVIGDYST